MPRAAPGRAAYLCWGNRETLGATDVRIRRRMEVLAFFGELLDQRAQFLDAAYCGADRQAFLAARITARLTRVQPVLHGAGKQTVGDIPDIGLLVAVGNLIAQIDGFAERFVERVRILLHGAFRGSRAGTCVRADSSRMALRPDAQGAASEAS